MFASNTKAYLSAPPFRCPTLGWAPGLTLNNGLRRNGLLGTKPQLLTNIPKVKAYGNLLETLVLPFNYEFCFKPISFCFR